MKYKRTTYVVDVVKDTEWVRVYRGTSRFKAMTIRWKNWDRSVMVMTSNSDFVIDGWRPPKWKEEEK